MSDLIDSKQKGIVFDIQRFSIHDGPGIRTVVFLKGCPLSCLWCQNPEGISPHSQLGFISSRCINCMNCMNICPSQSLHYNNSPEINFSSCITSGKCVEKCFSQALTVIGKWMTVEDILTEIEKDKLFYNQSNGGLTLSGGEPTLQISFTLAILKEAKKHSINTAIETSGFFQWNKFYPLLEYLDTIMIDLKIMDSGMHKKYCGVPNEQILSNINKLVRESKNLRIRFPVIPGINTTKKNISLMTAFLQDLNISSIELIPYHKLGQNKNVMIGKEPRDNHIKPIKQKELYDIAKRLNHVGITTLIN